MVPSSNVAFRMWRTKIRKFTRKELPGLIFVFMDERAEHTGDYLLLACSSFSGTSSMCGWETSGGCLCFIMWVCVSCVGMLISFIRGAHLMLLHKSASPRVCVHIKGEWGLLWGSCFLWCSSKWVVGCNDGTITMKFPYGGDTSLCSAGWDAPFSIMRMRKVASQSKIMRNSSFSDFHYAVFSVSQGSLLFCSTTKD